MIDPILPKAIIAGVGVAIATSIIGVFILWKKMAYFGDAISHSSMFGLAIATIISIAPIYGIVFCAIIFCFLIFLLELGQIYSPDTIIAIICSCLLALGLILLSLFPSSIELESYLFGDITLVNNQSIFLIYFIALMVLATIYFCFKPLLLATLSPDLATISGINVKKLELKFLLLTAIMIAGLVKIVGIFLITSLIILPAAIARNFAKSPIAMILIAILVSIIAMICGIIISSLFYLPSSPTIICFCSFLLVLSIIAKIFVLKNLGND